MDLLQVWYTRLKGRCSEDASNSAETTFGQPAKGVEHGWSGDTEKRLVVDIGANFGYYSLYAAAHGCRFSSVHASCPHNKGNL